MRSFEDRIRTERLGRSLCRLIKPDGLLRGVITPARQDAEERGSFPSPGGVFDPLRRSPLVIYDITRARLEEVTIKAPWMCFLCFLSSPWIRPFLCTRASRNRLWVPSAATFWCDFSVTLDGCCGVPPRDISLSQEAPALPR